MSKTEINTIDEKIAQLDQQIEWFYGDSFDLETATSKYQAATALAKEIKADLNNLQNQVELLEQDFSAE